MGNRPRAIPFLRPSPLPFGGESSRDELLEEGAIIDGTSPLPFGGESSRDESWKVLAYGTMLLSPLPFGGESSRDAATDINNIKK